MYPPPHAHAPAPMPVPKPPRRWWQHPALIVTALVVLPPVGIALAWTSQWERTRKVVATVLSGIWFLIPLLSDSPEKPQSDARPRAAASPTPSPTPTPTATPTPTPTPTPTANPLMPEIVGQPFGQAERMVEDLIDGELRAQSAYTDVPLPADHGTWLVCFQDLRSGTGLVPQYASPVAHLVAPGTGCPAEPNTVLHPKPSPTPTPAPDPTPAQEDDDSGTSGGGASVSYRNCDAVRAAGAAPIRRGDPGYGRHLDRDGDGVGCER
ncbi:excalibur calcium-binding domain-containing protein [Streptomyces virginiae]|uniref:excalibur calcium-binding domain-containing protein n=1 Tax=Streptomyces virginiae TaxID=1961 RepID=UPI002DB65A99|nr:excalibur calcium-binding domain-containing protein [Streptomyces sp. CMAA1738]MEC4575713.1 excalibur calcium-binding domain-containing protein [Streptomyces sp. CMAA1738]